jgi:putative spermidine/putrescine transport system permease protein
MNRPSRLALAVLVAALAFLVGPFGIVFVAGFSGGETLAFPPPSWSLRWVAHVFTVESFHRSFATSLVVALGSTLGALALGVPVAYALSRHEVPGREAVRTVLTLPLIVPGIIVGPTRLQAFFKVVLPNIRAAVAAAFVLAFITSFNQVPVSLFLTGPGVSTLPIEMMAYMETSYDPSIAALSTLLVAMTVGVVAATEKLLGISRYV